MTSTMVATIRPNSHKNDSKLTTPRYLKSKYKINIRAVSETIDTIDRKSFLFLSLGIFRYLYIHYTDLKDRLLQ